MLKEISKENMNFLKESMEELFNEFSESILGKICLRFLERICDGIAGEISEEKPYGYFTGIHAKITFKELIYASFFSWSFIRNLTRSSFRDFSWSSFNDSPKSFISDSIKDSARNSFTDYSCNIELFHQLLR